jgi:hypothetical protein
MRERIEKWFAEDLWMLCAEFRGALKRADGRVVIG